VEDALRETSCAAPDAMRRRLWQNIVEKRHESQAKAQSEGSPHVWRSVLQSRTARLTAAAVVFAGALAVGVETFRPRQSSRPHAFSAEIRANTALDLDPKAAIPLRQAQPEDFDVTWDGEGGGSLKIMSGSSVRILAPHWTDGKWDDVVAWAHRQLTEVQESTATSVPAHASRFAALLTSEGNLAIVEIKDYDQSRALLQWQVESTALPGFGPVQVVTLACVEPNHPSAQPCAIDFDTGRTSVIPAQALALAPEGFLGWLEQNGIDAVARMSDAGGCLTGVGLIVQPSEPGLWTAIPALGIRDIMSGASYQSRDPILFREGQYQFIHPFKTREGGVGVLEMRGVDRSAGTVQFRYKMVLEDAPAGTEGEMQDDADSLQLLQSANWLCDLGKSLLIYANDHEDRLPESLAIREFAQSEEEYQWLVKDVEYLGKGVTCAQSPSLLVAYDRTLLALGKGTTALFLDSHIEYVGPEKFAEYGLSGGVEAVMQRNAERDRHDRSREHLERLGRSLRTYGNFNQNRLPPSLEEIRQYLGREERYQWIAANVEYLGAGHTFAEPPSLVIAYDRSFLATGEGTYALFPDNHVEFIKPEKLAEHGLPAGVEDVTQVDAETLRSATWLCDLGKSLLIYANQNEDRLPESLAIRELANSEEQYQWMVKDVEYLGAGVTLAQSPSLVVAYDKTLLAAGKRTNVLFLDSHIELLSPDQLQKHGIELKR
jgi:hypothetical protein